MRPGARSILSAVALCLAASAAARDYPAQPVQVIAPFTEGSTTDVIARLVSGKLAEIWGQQVTVENHPGAGGSIGAGDVAKARPDGYTLLVHSSAQVINFAFYSKLPFASKDFTDIAPLGKQQMVLFVSSSSDAKSLPELTAAAKARPGQMKFGTPGVGSGAHLAAEQFRSKAGVDATNVPFAGGPEVIAATVDGTVDYSFLPLAIVLKGVREGKLRGLGTTGSARSRELPDVPTIAEAGVPGYEATVWYGLWAPAKIPSKVKDRLAKDVATALASEGLRAELAKRGFEPMSMPPDKFARFVRAEQEAAANTVKAAGIKPQ